MSFQFVRLLALLGVLATGVSAQLDHAVALVNDARSHGVLGDNLLSLNEVILLNKRAIPQTALSAGEQAQILGLGGDVAWADIDATVIPQITLEGDLDEIGNTAHGMIISGTNGLPVIDLANSRGFVVKGDFADFRNLIIENAARAIQITQDDAIYGTVIDGVVFRSIGTMAIEMTTATAMAETRLQIERTTFESVPTAVELHDGGANRRGNLIVNDTVFNGGTNGLLVHLGPGGNLNVLLERTRFSGMAQGLIFDRPQASDTRQVNLSSLHLTVDATQTAFSFEGHASVADAMQMRMMDLSGQQHALRLWPLGSAMDVIVEDGRLTGGVELLTGAAGSPGIFAANLRMRGGRCDLGSQGAPLRLTDSILDQVVLHTQGSATVLVDACRFIGGSAQGSASAPLDLSENHLGGLSVGASTNVTGSLPAAQLGSADVVPLEAVLGPSTTLTLQADLPPNLWGQWFFGLAETLPYLGPRPLHLYFWLSFHVAIPFPVTGQAQLPVRVPNDPGLIGWDFVAQLVVFPNGGLAAPPMSLPPGRRITIR